MNLADVSAFDVARLAAAAAAGWGLVAAFWRAVSGAIAAGMSGYTARNVATVVRSINGRDDDNTPPGPPAAA